MLIIVVNAKAELDTRINKLGTGVPLMDTITGASAIPLNEYSIETMLAMKKMLIEIDGQMAEGRCAEFKEQGKALDGCDDMQHYLVEIDLDRLTDLVKGKALKQLPTSFVLEADQVDDLRQAARTILQESSEFKRFLNDMN